MITIYLPRFNVTVGSMLITDVMSDSFYINGAVPPAGKMVLKNTIERTLKGKNFVFAVSDSLCVHEDEETPAHRFASMIRDEHDTIISASLGKTESVLEEFASYANGKMRSLSENSSDYGASFALLSIDNGTATMMNAGNVQGYVFRERLLIPLTKSDVYEKLFSAASSGVPDNKPTKFIGSAFGGESIKPHFSDRIPIEVDDVFLMCTNGLTDVLSEERIEYIMSLDIPDERIVHRLISEAVAGGAEDNVTVMIIRNGGKPVKSKRSFKGPISFVLSVVLLAVLTAFIVSSLHSCAKKPDIQVEEPVSGTVSHETENKDFMTPETSNENQPSDNEFILRSSDSNQ